MEASLRAPIRSRATALHVRRLALVLGVAMVAMVAVACSGGDAERVAPSPFTSAAASAPVTQAASATATPEDTRPLLEPLVTIAGLDRLSGERGDEIRTLWAQAQNARDLTDRKQALQTLRHFIEVRIFSGEEAAIVDRVSRAALEWVIASGGASGNRTEEASAAISAASSQYLEMLIRGIKRYRADEQRPPGDLIILYEYWYVPRVANADHPRAAAPVYEYLLMRYPAGDMGATLDKATAAGLPWIWETRTMHDGECLAAYADGSVKPIADPAALQQEIARALGPPTWRYNRAQFGED
jgi:hypothetical protein